MIPPEHGRRLAGLLPQGRLVEVADSYTLIPLDQPVRFAQIIREFTGASAVPHQGSRGGELVRSPGHLRHRSRNVAVGLGTEGELARAGASQGAR